MKRKKSKRGDLRRRRATAAALVRLPKRPHELLQTEGEICYNIAPFIKLKYKMKYKIKKDIGVLVSIKLGKFSM